MELELLNTYDELSEKAKDIIVDCLKENPNLLICAASGSSPSGAYELLGEEYKKQPELFDDLQIIKLDEWGGIPLDHPATCDSYLKRKLIDPLHIDQLRYINFNSDPADPQQECKRIQNKLDREGPIDICILGMGMNGHIAFNEPGDYLIPGCHVASLSETSLKHPMAGEMIKKPTFGLTLGMADILNSGMILFLVHGAQKKDIVKQFLSKKITSTLPASFLWLHSNVVCLIDKETMEDAGL